jgi:DNA-binding CsgD family transcriptional regulator
MTLLSAAAVWGRQFVLDDVSEILGEQPGRLLAPLQEVMNGRMVMAVGPEFAFCDDDTHLHIYSQIPEPVRLALHRQIGAHLLERGGSAVPAAHHFVQAARSGDARVLAGLDRATQEVLAVAPCAAAEFAQHALDLTETADAMRPARGITTIRALAAAHRLNEAIALARLLLDGDLPPDAIAEIRVDLSRILFMAGDIDEAVAEVEAVVATTGLSDARYAAAEAARLLALLAGGDIDRAREPAESILSGERNHGDDAALAGALTALSMLAWSEGHISDALSLIRGAVGRAEPGDADEVSALARLALGFMLVAVGEEQTAYALMRIVDNGRTAHTPWSILPTLFRARMHLACGHLDEAEKETNRALAIAEEHSTNFLSSFVHSVIAAIALLRDDTTRAGEQLAISGRSRRAASGHVAWIEARVLNARSSTAREAFDLLESVYADLASHRTLLIEEPGAAAWLVRAAVSEGKVTRAHRVAVAAEQLAADNRQYDCIGAIALHARGVLERDPDALRQAAASHWQPWARGSAAEDAAVVLAGLGRTLEARTQFGCALTAYEVSGSEHDAKRVQHRLEAVGRGRTGACRPLQGWDSLTAGELRVVSLVAEGLTNRQAAERAFLSRHTVDFHLRQAFRKLGITSRVELVRLVVDHERTGQE